MFKEEKEKINIVFMTHDGSSHDDDAMCGALCSFCMNVVNWVHLPRANSDDIASRLIDDQVQQMPNVFHICCDYGMKDQSNLYYADRSKDWRTANLIIIDHHHEEQKGSACIRLANWLRRNDLLYEKIFEEIMPVLKSISEHDEGVNLLRSDLNVPFITRGFDYMEKMILWRRYLENTQSFLLSDWIKQTQYLFDRTVLFPEEEQHVAGLRTTVGSRSEDSVHVSCVFLMMSKKLVVKRQGKRGKGAKIPSVLLYFLTALSKDLELVETSYCHPTYWFYTITFVDCAAVELAQKKLLDLLEKIEHV